MKCTSSKPCPNDAIFRLTWGQYGGGDFCQKDTLRIEGMLGREKYNKEPITAATEMHPHWSKP